jgi:O-antigen/teichoic acid export membrane protein
MNAGRNTLYNLAGAIIPLAVALISVPFYIKLVGIERYGALAISWLILGYFGLFDMGLGRATAQRIAKLKDDGLQQCSDVFWTALIISILFGMIGAVLLYFAGEYYVTHYFVSSGEIKTEILNALPILALIVPIVTMASVATGALQGREHFIDYNIGTTLGSVLFQLLPLFCAFWFGPDLAGLMIAAGIARLLGLIYIQQRIWAKMLSGMKVRFDRSSAAALFGFGGWMTLTGIISPLLFIVDRLAISATLGAAAVAIYSVPYQISSRLAIIPTALSNAVFPKISYHDRAEGDRMWNVLIRVLLAGMTPLIVGLIFNMQWFLQLWVGREIADQAYLVGQILMICAWSLAMAMVPLTILHGRAQPKQSLLVYIVEIPLYLLALWFGMQQFGLIGAALAYAFRCVLDAILLSMIAGGFPAWRGWVCSFILCIAAIFGAQLYGTHLLVWMAAMILCMCISIFLSLQMLPQEQLQKLIEFVPLKSKLMQGMLQIKMGNRFKL